MDGLSVPTWDPGEAKVLGPRTFKVVVIHGVRGERSMEDVDCKGATVCSCCQFKKVYTSKGPGIRTWQVAGCGLHEHAAEHGDDSLLDLHGVLQVLLGIVKVQPLPFPIRKSPLATVVDGDRVCLVDLRSIVFALADAKLKAQQFALQQEFGEDRVLHSCQSRYMGLNVSTPQDTTYQTTDDAVGQTILASLHHHDLPCPQLNGVSIHWHDTPVHEVLLEAEALIGEADGQSTNAEGGPRKESTASQG